MGLILGPVLLAFALQAVEEGGRGYRQRFLPQDMEADGGLVAEGAACDMPAQGARRGAAGGEAE